MAPTASQPVKQAVLPVSVTNFPFKFDFRISPWGFVERNPSTQRTFFERERKEVRQRRKRKRKRERERERERDREREREREREKGERLYSSSFFQNQRLSFWHADAL